MPPRQLWIFKFGCWTAIVTGLVHMAGHIFGPTSLANDTERQLMDLATSYHFPMPGGASRSLMNFLDGFGLTFVLMTVMSGALGIAIARRGREDALLMTGAARVLAIGYVGLLVISLQYFFIVPSLFVALAAVCFSMASVRQ
jgi:hypothetical protein